MKLFLDTSVLLSATASNSGASREIFRRSKREGWVLITTPYGIDEVERNLDFLQRYTLAIDFSTRVGAQAQLEATNAFRDAQQADAEGVRLVLP